MNAWIASLRIILATLLICVAAYTALILGVARAMSPTTAEGSLIKAKNGQVVGSRLLAQSFTNPAYLWPRPSAANHQANAAAGSNKSPASPELTERARSRTLPAFGATRERPLPADLAAASGSGLDPHIAERGATYQAERIAQTRHVAPRQIEELIAQHARAVGGYFAPERLVNVLEVNLALDESFPKPAGP